jgi:hypothetical protein
LADRCAAELAAHTPTAPASAIAKPATTELQQNVVQRRRQLHDGSAFQVRRPGRCVAG